MSTIQIEQLMKRVAKLEQLLELKVSGEQEACAEPTEAPKEKKQRNKCDRNEHGQALNKDGSVRKKRSASGWDLFCSAQRAAVREQLARNTEEGKPKASEVAKVLAGMWHDLGEEGKMEWKERAAATKDSEE